MFLFAIVAVGCWAKLRVTILVTSLCVVLYLCAIWLSVINVTNAYLMRAVYLAIAGYVINFFGQEREKFEARSREFETEAERHAIARSLHDGYIQSLAGIGLRLESCCDMLASNELAQAIAGLEDIQISVDREFDEVRAYVRSLVQAAPANGHEACREASKTKFQIRAAFTGNGLLAEQILQIMLEGIRNARLYGQACSAAINVREENNGIRLTIDDDGVGFETAARPWTIVSRVAECGGHLIVHSNISPGAHIEIEMPASGL